MTLNTTRWRTHPQNMQLYAAFVRPVAVFARRVNQSSFTYPLAAVTYDDPDGGAGVYTDVRPHMTLGVYSSAGAFKGLLRVRKAPTASTLYISEVARGDLDFADDDRLVVYADYRLWARVPRITSDGQFYKDYDLPAGDEGEKMSPMANTGPAFAGFVDASTGRVTVSFDGSGSYRIAHGATEYLSYQWTLPAAATVTGGSLTSSSVTATFPAGLHWVDLTVTDSQGSTARAVCPVLACDEGTGATYPAVPVTARLSGTIESGWEAEIQIAAGDVSDLLPGAQVVLFAAERYGTDSGAVRGYTGREHVKFVGWLPSEDLTIEPDRDTVTLTARSALGVLQALAGFSASIENNLAPSKWHQMVMPSLFHAVHYLLTWHSTAALVCDLERASYWIEYDVKALDFPGGTAGDQVRDEIERAWSRFTCDRAGRLYVRRNPHLMTDTERAALVPAAALGAGDWRGAVEIRRRATRPTGWLKGAGFTSSWTGPHLVIALAPGAAPGQGPAQRELTGLYVEDQAELNVRLGHRYARDNAAIDNIRLTLAHQGLPFDPAWGEVVTLTLDAATNKRGIAFDAAQMVVSGYEVAHDPETGTTDEVLTLQPLAYGAPATTQPVPDADWQDVEWTPSEPDFATYQPPDLVTPGYGDGLGPAILALNVAVENSGAWYRGGMIFVTGGLSSAPDVNWTTLHTGLPAHGDITDAVSGRIFAKFLDFHNPDRCIIAGDFGVYYNPAWADGGTWSEVASLSELQTALAAHFPTDAPAWLPFHLFPTVAQEGTLYLLGGANNGAYLLRILDYAGTPTIQACPYEIKVASSQNRDIHVEGLLFGTGLGGCVYTSKDDPDWVVIAGHVGSGHPFGSGRYGVWNGNFNAPAPTDGSEWLPRWQSGEVDGYGAMCYVGFKKLDGSDNDNHLEIFAGFDGRLYRATNGVSNFAAWGGDGPNTRGYYNRDGPRIDMFEQSPDGSTVAYLQSDDYVAGTTPSRLVTGNPTDGFTAHNLPDSLGMAAWMGGWPANGSQFYVGRTGVNYDFFAQRSQPLVMLTTDLDAGTWVDLTGDLWDSIDPAAFWSGRYLRAGVVRLTPHWTRSGS